MKILTTNNNNFYYYLLIIVVLILSLFSTNVTANDPVCMSDELITGQAKQVDWWFIIKIRGFSDVYYYYDSEMDSANEGNFKIGHFLRSKFSAFGATLLPYANAVLPTDTGFKPATDTGFLAYGDSLKHGEIDVKDFYTYGAHEKGIIGWSTKGGVGLIIQHSLPNFPYGIEGTMNPPVLSDETKTKINDKEIQMHFTQYGWKFNFFGKNLMPYYIPGKKFWKESVEPFKDDVIRFTRGKKDGIRNHGQVYYINTSEYELFSLLYSTLVKPSQQIFCLSLVDASTDPPSTPGKKVKDMVQYLSNLSDKGLFAAKYSDNANQYFPHTDGFVSYPQQLATLATPRDADDDKTNKRSYKESTITVGTKTYYMRINAGSEESNKNKGKSDDVWHSLLLSPSNQPKLLDTEEFVISTWASKKKDSWWKSNNKIISPTFKIDVYENTFKWVGNSQQEHSKIGFRKTGGNDWNVCSSGGNLYNNARTRGIKSSLLICFKSDGLRQALLNIMVDSSGNGDDSDLDIDDNVDDVVNEDDIEKKKPSKLSKNDEFIKSLNEGTPGEGFKHFYQVNYNKAKEITSYLETLKSYGAKKYYSYHRSPHDDLPTQADVIKMRPSKKRSISDTEDPDGTIPQQARRPQPTGSKNTADNKLLQLKQKVKRAPNPTLKRVMKIK